MATTTTGYHRFANVTDRAQYGLLQEVVPGATIYVTLTSSGAGATIYSDPAMTVQIVGSLITADPSGFYEYFIPLNYNVTETITSVSGLEVIITNIVLNTGPLGSQTPVVNEVVGGSGLSFFLAHIPVAGSQALYHGGARLWPTVDYEILNQDIQMNYSIPAGSLLADYRY